MSTLHYTAIILKDKENKNALLLKRSAEKKLNPNTYSGLGGKLEAGETPLQCVLREGAEEAPHINWEKDVTDVCHHLTLTRHRPDGVTHVMHWFTGTLNAPLNDFSSTEGTLHWKPLTAFPLPRAEMSAASYIAIPFILSRPVEETTLHHALLDETTPLPTLTFLNP